MGLILEPNEALILQRLGYSRIRFLAVVRFSFKLMVDLDKGHVEIEKN